jgi:hypothetical protein
MTANQQSGDVSVLLGLGDGRFVASSTVASDIRATPVVGDLNGDGVPDVAVLNRQGRILLRQGRPGAPGTFAPPVLVNPAPDPPARDLALVRTATGLVLAALDTRDSSVALYTRRPDGTFAWTAGPVIPTGLPIRLAAGDLNGDGRDDLVVAAAGSDRVFVYLQHADGTFGLTPDYQGTVGIAPSAITLADVDGDGRLDIVVTNQFSGDVSVLRNDPAAPFAVEQRFRAGAGLYGMEQVNGQLAVDTFEGAAGVATGRFDEEHGTSLVITNSGANTVSLLPGTGDGGFLNAALSRTFGTGTGPTAVAAGDFNGDGHLDLAVLDRDSGTISVFLGDGHGHFTADGTLSAGNAPTGLAVADVNGDGIADLLVGNEFGDLLVLRGNGDGTFQPYRRTDGQVTLAVADLKGDGEQDFIFADPSLDQVSVQYAQPGQTFKQDRNNGLLAPGAVAVADLTGGGISDLIVANSGANDVLVYPGLGNGQFGPARSFSVGTDPVGITIKDLNGDGIPDLVVANEGSNDVSILLGQGRGGDWTLVPGPRLVAGAGPVSTTVADVTGNGIPDLLVTNSQSNNIYLLPGVGGGFFDDQHPQIFATGSDPRQALVGDFNGDGRLDLVTINAGSNDVTYFADFGSGRSIASGGDTPVAAVAGDFTNNGTTDLLVANNGDGHVALLDSTPEGPAFDKLFSSPDAPHPTDIAVADTNVYVTNEGQESAVLLTSFGIPVPGTVNEPRPPLGDVLLANGPGFESALVVRGQPEGSLNEAGLAAAEEIFPQRGAAGGPPEQEAIAGEQALAEASPQLAGASEEGAPAPPPSGGGDDALAPGADSSSGEGATLSTFQIGVEDALRRHRPDPGPIAAPPSALPADGTPTAGDQVFGDLLAAASRDVAAAGRFLVRTGMDELGSMASALGAACQPLGVQSVPLADVPWQDIGDALSEAGAAVTRALAEVIRARLESALPAAAPAGLDPAEVPCRLPLRIEGTDEAHGVGGDPFRPVFLDFASERTGKAAELWLAALGTSGCCVALLDKGRVAVRRRSLPGMGKGTRSLRQYPG